MGDFNCPGVTCDCVDTRLTAALACYSLKIVNEGPTRLNYDGDQNKLDVIIETDDGGHLCDVYLLSVQVSQTTVYWKRVWTHAMTRYSYGDIKNMDVDSFRASLRSSVSFTNPPTDPNDIVVQWRQPSVSRSSISLHVIKSSDSVTTRAGKKLGFLEKKNLGF